MLKIKDLEKKILLNLLENGHQPVRKIADDIGLTRQTVTKKLGQMRDSGLLILCSGSIISYVYSVGIKYDGFVKTTFCQFFVIPAKAGI